jgi:hypothetical protein
MSQYGSGRIPGINQYASSKSSSSSKSSFSNLGNGLKKSGEKKWGCNSSSVKSSVAEISKFGKIFG